MQVIVAIVITLILLIYIIFSLLILPPLSTSTPSFLTSLNTLGIFPIATTAIGGLLTYAYISVAEKRKEKRSKKENCTKALLSTQMTLMTQMETLKSVGNVMSSILNFNLAEAPLEHWLKTTEKVSEMISILYEIAKRNNYHISFFMQLTQYIISPATDNRISLPYEIFDLAILIRSNEIINETVLAGYFKELTSCNLKYAQLISSIQFFNDVRSKEIDHLPRMSSGEITEEEWATFLSVVAGAFKLARESKVQIADALSKAEKAFLKAGDYIDKLGISQSIQVARNAEGQIIFD